MQPKTGIWGYGATETFFGRLIWQSIKAPLWPALEIIKPKPPLQTSLDAMPEVECADARDHAAAARHGRRRRVQGHHGGVGHRGPEMETPLCSVHKMFIAVSLRVCTYC